MLPYKVDVPFNHRPVMNWLLIGAVIGAFALQIAGDKEYIKTFVLDGWGIKGLLGHMWLHGSLLHLAGNLVFLWVFGNAVCSKIQNIVYLPIYLFLGLAAAFAHLMFCDERALGASGAINGIVGMYLVFFPENSVSLLFWFLWHPIRFSVSGFWVIGGWFLFDIIGAAEGTGNTAYFAHIGGFVTGFALAIALLKLKFVKMERDEKSILQLLRLEKRPEAHSETRYVGLSVENWQRQMIADEQLAKELPPDREKKAEFIRFHCSCGKRIKVQARYAGKAGRCPKCRQKLVVPDTY